MSRRQLPRQIEKPAYDISSASCGTCPYAAQGAKNPTKPRIVSNSRFLVVLDQPDPVSVKHGELRTTVSQKLVEKSLAASGAQSVSYAYSTACRRPPEATDKDENQAIASCAPRLASELNAVRGDLDSGELFWVLSSGPIALKATTGKLGNPDSWYGSPIDGVWPATKVIGTFDPWFISTKAGLRYGTVFQKHLERYVKLQTGELQEWVWPETVVDNCADALRRVLAVAIVGGEYGFDIEATGLDFEKDTITCLGFAIQGLAVSVQLPCTPEEDALCRQILESGVMVGQNLTGYDRRMMGAKGYKLTPHYEDLMFAHLVLEPQHKVRKLGWQASTETWAPAWKSEFRQDDTGNTYWDRGSEEQEREKRVYNSHDSWMSLFLWQQSYKPRLAAYK